MKSSALTRKNVNALLFKKMVVILGGVMTWLNRNDVNADIFETDGILVAY